MWFILLQTTLLNHILTSQHGKRIAVIENEVWIQLLLFILCENLSNILLEVNKLRDFPDETLHVRVCGLRESEK